ncbi:hypothetical protein LCGC14_2969440 [marine sediment metagenome]|uniref:Uncharacterized protein n=1 Tax=marine sediment metagenome TaxID=412755 RepID=A0A0F9A137_9ZZZZ
MTPYNGKTTKHRIRPPQIDHTAPSCKLGAEVTYARGPAPVTFDETTVDAIAGLLGAEARRAPFDVPKLPPGREGQPPTEKAEPVYQMTVPSRGASRCCSPSGPPSAASTCASAGPTGPFGR